MKLRIGVALLALALALPSAFARSSGYHHSSHKHYSNQGGHYASGHGSSHKGGHYKNARTHNHYTHHQ